VAPNAGRGRSTQRSEERSAIELRTDHAAIGFGSSICVGLGFRVGKRRRNDSAHAKNGAANGHANDAPVRSAHDDEHIHVDDHVDIDCNDVTAAGNSFRRRLVEDPPKADSARQAATSRTWSRCVFSAARTSSKLGAPKP
jgi:hypothetical protein